MRQAILGAATILAVATAAEWATKDTWAPKSSEELFAQACAEAHSRISAPEDIGGFVITNEPISIDAIVERRRAPYTDTEIEEEALQSSLSAF